MMAIDPLERQLPALLTELAEPRTPDYVDDLLERTGQAHQRPAWTSLGGWLPTIRTGRILPSAWPVLLRLMVVALVLVIGGGILIITSNNQVAGPTPTPSPSAAPLTVVPDALRMVRPDGTFPEVAIWVSGPRSLPGPGADSGTVLRFTETTLALTRSRVDLPLSLSTAEGTAEGVLRLTTSASCGDGATGEYRWGISPDGRHLTISAVADACAVRLAAVPGDWLRIACKDTRQPCLADLAAGTYPSLNFAPHLQTNDTATPVYGALRYTVPEGWANAADLPGQFVLVKSSDYASYGPGGATNGSVHELVVASNPALSDQTGDCAGAPVASVDHSVQGFVDWLRAQSRIESSVPTPIEIAGHRGQSIDLRVAPSWTGTCPDDPDGTPTAVILTPYAPFGPVPELQSQSTGADPSWALVGEERMRLILVDVGEGDIVLVQVVATDPARFESLAAEAMPIIQSMTFD